MLLHGGGLLIADRQIGLWRIFPGKGQDLTFHPALIAGTVRGLALQGDKILILCDRQLLRLDKDGDRDLTFAVPVLKVHQFPE